MSIHTVGDSHSVNGWNGIHSINGYSGVISHHLGASLCYSFGRDQLKLIDLRNYNIENGDTIVFCLGEIDCRCHVHKHITDTNDYKSVIDIIIDNYFAAIKLTVETSQIKLKNVCVYNVVPPIEKQKTPENPLQPYLGTDEERKTYVLYFNERLKEECQKNNYIFFDIYDKYTDENGFLIKDLSDGNVHIYDGKYITEFINENLYEKNIDIEEFNKQFLELNNIFESFKFKMDNINVLHEKILKCVKHK